VSVRGGGQPVKTEAVETSPRPPYLRLIATAALLAGLTLAAHQSGLLDDLSARQLQELFQGAGPLGAGLFILAFAVGNLLSIPGVLFVITGLLAYGQIAGAPIVLLGGLVAVSVSFCAVRLVGGQPAALIRNDVARRLLSNLTQRPVITVVVLRLMMSFSPPLNYALALAPIKYRDYLLGSLIGLLFPVAFYAVLLDQLLARGWLDAVL